MSEHKSGLPNWTTEEKALYRERRQQGLSGQVQAVTVHRAIKDEEGNDQLVPLGNRTGAALSRGKSSPTRQYQRQQQRAFVRQQRKASGRGE